MTAASTLIVEQLGRVRRITLNRPEKLNALSQQMLSELSDELADAEDDVATHVVVLRGAGRAFSAGFDVSPAESKPTRRGVINDLVGLLRQNGRIDAVWNCRLPVIAQVHGHCLAGGSDLALNCDIVVAADDARIGYPPVRSLGVAPMQMWLYHVGPQWSKRLLFTGDTVSGRRAEQIGLVQHAVPAADLDAETLSLATRIGNVGRELLIGSKLVVNQGVELMGRSMLHSFAATQDAIGHASPSAKDFRAAAAESGFATAMADQAVRFGDGHID